jgi:hypothetical protein
MLYGLPCGGDEEMQHQSINHECALHPQLYEILDGWSIEERADATHVVAEEYSPDGLAVHPFPGYLCCRCFGMVMGPDAVGACEIAAASSG